jgi:hypothetical protein
MENLTSRVRKVGVHKKNSLTNADFRTIEAIASIYWSSIDAIKR